MATSSAQHLYVYCAVRGSVSPRALATLPKMPEGAAPRPLNLTGDITLVVADVPTDTYRTETIEARLGDLDWVALCGAAHHDVADALARKHNVVPFRLFTLFSSQTKALSTLGRASTRIDEALDRVKGKVEWVLKISKGPPSGGPFKPALKPGGKAAEKAGLKAGPSPTPSGTAFLAAKAAARRAAAEIALRTRKEAASAFDALEAIANQAHQRSIDAATGLLLDAAFLVSIKREAAFKKALSKAVKGLLADGCRVNVTGPWPPYSFVALDSNSNRG